GVGSDKRGVQAGPSSAYDGDVEAIPTGWDARHATSPRPEMSSGENKLSLVDNSAGRRHTASVGWPSAFRSWFRLRPNAHVGRKEPGPDFGCAVRTELTTTVSSWLIRTGVVARSRARCSLLVGRSHGPIGAETRCRPSSARRIPRP